MNGEDIFAVAYNLEFDLHVSKPSATVTFSWVISNRSGVAIRTPEKWSCELPTRRDYTDFILGTSETRGILGGVHHPFLETQSEVIERFIGDCLTTCVADILDTHNSESTILILGPAFPKLLGRILSLHPPGDVAIGWIVPTIMPNERIGNLWRLLMPFQAYEHPSEWSEEALLNYFPYPLENHAICWVQYLELGDGAKTKNNVKKALSSPVIKGDYRRLTDSNEQLCELQLPKEMNLALDVPILARMPHIQEWHGENGINYLKIGEDRLPPYLSSGTARGRPTYTWKNEALSKIKS